MCEGNPGEIDFSSSKQGFELSGMDCTIPLTVTPVGVHFLELLQNLLLKSCYFEFHVMP